MAVRRLLSPAWIVSHVVVLAIVVTFPQLGLWQLRRYDEVRADAARLEQRLDRAPVPLDEAPTDDVEFVRVRTTGTWLAQETVAQRNRELDGQSGFDLLTPLALDDGTAVMVRRGWVPPDRQGSPDPLDPGPPPAGPVDVVGWLEPSGTQPSFGPRDPVDGRLEVVFHADVSRLDQQVERPLRPVVLHLQEAVPAGPGELPRPQPPPVLDDTSNLSYALQWFAFTLIAIVGYAIVLTRRLRGQDRPTE